MNTADLILRDVEGHCHSGGGHEFPNASSLRVLATEVERVRAERDAFHAYAAFLQAQSTMAPEWKAWTHEGAVGWTERQALRPQERVGWSQHDRDHLAAIVAVMAKRGEADPCSTDGPEDREA